VLAVSEPDPDLWTLPLAEQADCGMFPGRPGRTRWGPFDPMPGFQVEQREDFEGEPDPERWIWETAEGVVSRHPPDTLLLMHPRLWVPYAAWHAGQHEARPGDSNFIEEAINTLTAAAYRRPPPDPPKGSTPDDDHES
jgi:hypothetical protein